jgi:hypothetical protein
VARKKKQKSYGLGDALSSAVTTGLVGSVGMKGGTGALVQGAAAVGGSDKLSPEMTKALKKSMGATDVDLINPRSMLPPQASHADVLRSSGAIPKREGLGLRASAPGRRRRLISVPHKAMALAEGTGPVSHELGHLTGKGLSINNKAWHKAYMLGRGPLPLLGGLAAGFVAGSKGKKTESMGATARRGAGYGAVAGLVGGSPTIIEEGRATVRGLKHLRRIGVKGGRFWRAAGGMALAGATYPLALGGVGAMAGAGTAPFRRVTKAKKS